MAKHPKVSFIRRTWHRSWAMAKRNPITTIIATVGGVVTILGGLTGAVAGYEMVVDHVPAVTIWRAWVRNHVAEVLKPVLVTQNQQAIGMDRFLLYSVKKDLESAQKDPASAHSSAAQDRIRDLAEQKKQAEYRICMAEHRPRCARLLDE